MSLKLYGGNGHRVNKSGKDRDNSYDDAYDYDPRYDARYDDRSRYDARYDDRGGRRDARYDDRSARYDDRNAAASRGGGYRSANGYDAPYDDRYGYDDYGQPTPPPKKKKSGWKVFGTVMLVLAILIGCAYAYWTLTTKAPKKAESPSAASPAAAAENEDESEKVNGSNDRYYTILIVGKDVAGLNTDTMMLCRYDSVDHKLNVCSLPRDTLVNISASTKKLNNVYAANNADIDALLDGVKDITGFRPDNYVLIDTDVFVKMIDALGGVDFDVPVEMFYDDPGQHLHIALNKGYQHLDGEQTMGCFRFRHTYANGDLQRIDVQHDLIKACASQWLQLGNWSKLLPAAKIVLDNAKTDLTYGNMQWYAKEFFKMSSDDISFMTIPSSGAMIRNLSYVTIKVDDWITMVNTYLNPTETPITKEDCNILQQLHQESGKYTVTQGNYVSTNGSGVAGGVNSFYLNKG